MWPVLVVVGCVRIQYLLEMAATEDQHPVYTRRLWPAWLRAPLSPPRQLGG